MVIKGGNYYKNTDKIADSFTTKNVENFTHVVDHFKLIELPDHECRIYLCNPTFWSDNIRWRTSPYAKHFTTGLVDPLAEEAAGEAYVADTDTQRTDQGAVLSFLQAKYGTGPLMNMDMNMASVEIVVPK